MKTHGAVLGRTAVLLMLASAGVLAEDVRLARRLDAILSQHAAIGAIMHARVAKLPEREELYARNADKPCKPASNYKLLTTATGLDLFGSRHTFKTFLAARERPVDHRHGRPGHGRPPAGCRPQRKAHHAPGEMGKCPEGPRHHAIFNQASDAASTLHDQACRVLARWPELDSFPSR